MFWFVYVVSSVEFLVSGKMLIVFVRFMVAPWFVLMFCPAFYRCPDTEIE